MVLRPVVTCLLVLLSAGVAWSEEEGGSGPVAGAATQLEEGVWTATSPPVDFFEGATGFTLTFRHGQGVDACDAGGACVTLADDAAAYTQTLPASDESGAGTWTVRFWPVGNEAPGPGHVWAVLAANGTPAAWKAELGSEQATSRFVEARLDEAVAGAPPLLWVTTARHEGCITCSDQVEAYVVDPATGALRSVAGPYVVSMSDTEPNEAGEFCVTSMRGGVTRDPATGAGVVRTVSEPYETFLLEHAITWSETLGRFEATAPTQVPHEAQVECAAP